MLDALVAGQDSPHDLARLARGKMRAKTSALQEGLTGHFTDHHAFMLGMMLDRIDALTTQISTLTTRIEQAIAPLSAQVAQLDEIPGIGTTAAQDILAESGSPGASPRRSPLRTVHARHPGTRLKQAPRALRALVLTSCVCGPGARGRRRHVSSGFGSRPACHARPGGRGTRRRSPCGPRSATTVPTPGGLGLVVGQ
jgi:transposase